MAEAGCRIRDASDLGQQRGVAGEQPAVELLEDGT